MRRAERRSLAIMWFLFVAVCAATHAQTPPRVRDVDASPIITQIQTAARDAGCDVNHCGLDIVLAFATSHFGSDPGHAEGMRQLALDFLRRFSAQGDRVAVAGWEMDLWSWAGPVTLVGGTPAERANAVAPLLPRTPRAGSIGGHDTERSICSIWQRARATLDPSSCVIVLFTSHQASMLPPTGDHETLLGANAPKYTATLQELTRLPACVVGFSVTKLENSSLWVPRRADIIVLIPRKLTGGQRIPGRPGGPVVVPPQRSPDGHPHSFLSRVLRFLSRIRFLLLAIAVLLVVGALMLAMRRLGERPRATQAPAAGGLMLVVGDKEIRLKAPRAKTPTTLVEIVQEGAAFKAPGAVEAHTQNGSGDGSHLADIVLTRRGILLKRDPNVDLFVDGVPQMDPEFPLGESAAGKAYACEFVHYDPTTFMQYIGAIQIRFVQPPPEPTGEAEQDA